MLDNVVTTILDLTDVAFVIVQGTAPSVAGLVRLLPVLEGLGLPPSHQRLVLNYNYKPFLGNLRPRDIADRLLRKLDYVVPYEKRILVSMNTGSPYILHANRWQPYRRTIDQLVDDLEGGGAVAASEQSGRPQAREEHRRRVGAARPGVARISS